MKSKYPSLSAIARYAKIYSNKGFPRSQCCGNLRNIFKNRDIWFATIGTTIRNAEYFERLGGYEF